MRDIDSYIEEVNDGIVAVGKAKKELFERSRELVRSLRANGQTYDDGMAMIAEGAVGMETTTANWARFYYNQAWFEETGASGTSE